nr:hypothetical protein MFLOJ_30670 [Mycobacterium florentinum]
MTSKVSVTPTVAAAPIISPAATPATAASVNPVIAGSSLASQIWVYGQPNRVEASAPLGAPIGREPRQGCSSGGTGGIWFKQSSGLSHGRQHPSMQRSPYCTR